MAGNPHFERAVLAHEHAAAQALTTATTTTTTAVGTPTTSMINEAMSWRLQVMCWPEAYAQPAGRVLAQAQCGAPTMTNII